MSETRDEFHVPRGALIGAALLIGFSLVFATVARLTDKGATRLALSPVAETRSLHFSDLADGGIAVIDAKNQKQVAILPAGHDGFVRVVVHGLAQDRAASGLGAGQPFNLNRLQDGTSVLEDPATGRIVTPTVQPTRDEADFASHIGRTIATDPAAGWIFIADNLTTHCSATLVLMIAGLCGVPAESLGKKGTSGVLKSVATRKAFLTDARHRIRFVYVPKHTSWLNQVEIWFSVLARRVIRRGSFTSKADLRKRLLDFVEYFNRTMAKPYKWTYAGRPLNV